MPRTDAPTAEPTEQPRRPTPTERYHELALLAAARQPAAPEHTLELESVRGGAVLIRLAVRSHDLDELEQAATATFDRLYRKYGIDVDRHGVTE